MLDLNCERDRARQVPVKFGFRLRAWPDPQSIARIAGVFAQRSLIPTAFRCTDEGSFLSISIEAELPTEGMAERIRRKLEALVVVDQPVSLERKD